MKGEEIEEESMRIIEEEIGSLKDRYDKREWLIVRRVIHTTADYDFASNNRVIFHNAIDAALNAIANRCYIVCDTDIIYAALNKRNLNRLGLKCICKINDADVIDDARKSNRTRAEVSMRASINEIKNNIVIIGNAPTALLAVLQLIDEGIRPSLIIATPVGFVNAKESKDMLMNYDIPYITNIGRKGGSTVAAAIMNALMTLC
ncbi:MAG: precorrin-8X methylmutase [Candidatus Nitrosocaldaceae archaeon]